MRKCKNSSLSLLGLLGVLVLDITGWRKADKSVTEDEVDTIIAIL